MKRVLPQEPIMDKDVFALPGKRGRKHGPRPKIATWVFVAWVVLVVVWIVKVYVEQPHRRFAPDQAASPLVVEVTTPWAATTGGLDVAALGIVSLEQSLVDNETMGEAVWVLSGEVVNRGLLPVDNVALSLTVRAEDGQVVEEITRLAGVSVPLFQLKTLSLAEIRALLQNRVQILAVNHDLESGASLPFMFVLPESAVKHLLAREQSLGLSVSGFRNLAAPGSS